MNRPKKGKGNRTKQEKPREEPNNTKQVDRGWFPSAPLIFPTAYATVWTTYPNYASLSHSQNFGPSHWRDRKGEGLGKPTSQKGVESKLGATNPEVSTIYCNTQMWGAHTLMSHQREHTFKVGRTSFLGALWCWEIVLKKIGDLNSLFGKFQIYGTRSWNTGGKLGN